MKTLFYYEFNSQQTLITRVVCVACESVEQSSFDFTGDDFDKKQFFKGYHHLFSFGSSIFRNEKCEKNLPLKSIRHNLLQTAKGRHVFRPLFAYAADPKVDYQEFKTCMRHAVHVKKVRDAIRIPK
jgi:hypothetical protein